MAVKFEGKKELEILHLSLKILIWSLMNFLWVRLKVPLSNFDCILSMTGNTVWIQLCVFNLVLSYSKTPDFEFRIVLIQDS